MKVLELTNMYPTQNRLAWGTFVQEQVESVRKEGIEIDVLVIDGWHSKLNYLWGFFRFWSRLLTHRYDLIHAHYVFSGIIARAQLLYPVVLTHHGLEVFVGWQRFPSRIINHLVNRVIVRSQEMREKLGFSQAEIIPAGIDMDMFKPLPREEARKKLSLHGDKKLVLWAGQPDRPEKRFDIVKESVALAQEKDPMIELVTATGKPHNVIPLYMNACDALLLVSNAEGSPNVIKEAMACNLPVVSVPVGDVPEIIGNTEGCYLCSQDPSDVAEKLQLALRHSKRTHGRDMIKHLEQGEIAKQIVSLYQDVLRKKNRQTGDNLYLDNQRIEK
jgi:teichuronic acid biosynthesis glycosyltransferase TuaC